MLLLSGELNTFAPEEAERILAGARRALAPSGSVVLEVHPEDAVRSRAEPSTAWFSADRSVFSDEPHLCLIERRFDTASRTTLERFFVASGDADELRVYTSSTRAYSDRELDSLLEAADLGRVERYPSLAGTAPEAGEDFVVLVCRDLKRE